ncbi:MAG: sarcosine oxidase subunit delta, partial [Alphaproteobacteria bacterium]|nr:sarcosine oxidase subunit delta [Alphaproteobacteria bacterium]
MHRLRCPWCGVRDEAEFAYQGDATKVRPTDDADVDAFFDYVYGRANPKGWHVEW